MTVRSSIYTLALGHLSVDWCQSALPALLPYFIAHHGLSYQAAATLVFANMMVASVLQPLFGYYADRISRPWFIAIGPVACGLCVTLLGLVGSYPLIFAASMLGGMGSAIYHPEAAMLSGKLGGSKQGQAMSTFSIGGNAGFAVGPVIAGLCAYTIGIKSLAFFGLVNVVIAAVLLRNLPNALRLAEASLRTERAEHPGQTQLNDWRSFGRLSLVVMARSLGFTLTNTFLPIFFITVLGVSAQFGANILSVLFALGTLLTLLGGLLADRIGCVKVLRISFLCMVPTMFVLSRCESLCPALALLPLVAVPIFLPYSPMVLLGQRYLAKNAGFASGVTLGLSTTLGGLVAPAVGWVADTCGLITALQILWLAGIMGCVGAFALKLDLSS